MGHFYRWNLDQVTALVGFLAIGFIVWGFKPVEAQPVNARQARAADAQLEKQIQDNYSLPVIDAVRLHLWSVFGTVERFGTDLGVSRSAVEQFLGDHRWELPHAPALVLQNKDLSGRNALRVSTGKTASAGDFVSRDGGPANPATDVSIGCDSRAIIVSITCQEPSMERLTANVPTADPLPQEERWFWNGDMVALKKNVFQNDREAIKRLGDKQNSPPETSVLLDDCVVVFLTPVAIGKDRSYLFPAPFVPDPAEWLKETKPPAESRVFLEGAYYAVAVNPNGAVLDVFFDPWDGGTVCPAWRCGALVTTRKDEQSWAVDMRIPWSSLKPNVNEDAVWGVDLARIRRCGASPGEVTRSGQSTLVRYDVPVTEPVAKLRPVPEITVRPLPTREPTMTFPAPNQWEAICPVDEFYDNRTGRRADDVEARVTYDAKRLYVRFDCHERDLGRLRVVTREEELAEYGETNRKCNYLDRREQFGLDWGDYVEVILAPNLDFADRHHGGVFTFLVNSRGDLLERYYDGYGMFNVSPEPEWQSGAKVRVVKADETWSAELAIPLDVLCTMGKVSSRWGLNVHRCRSTHLTGGRETHLCWSPTRPSFEAPGWPVTLRSLRDGRRLGVMRLEPEHVTLAPHPNCPKVAVARSEEAAKARPVRRDHTSDRLGSVCFVDRQHGWAVGGLGTILHTSEGGATWQPQDSGTDFILEKVSFIDRRHGWVVGGWPRDAAVSLYGGMGVILATNDGGRHWSKQLDGEATWLKGVFFLDRDRGWAVGEYGTVLRTTDGGEHWRQITKTGTAAWLYGIAFLDERTGFAVGHDETILRTGDGGRTWTVQPSPVPRRVNGWPSAYRAVAFADALHGWIVGDGGSILETTDGGRSWRLDEIDLPDAAVSLASFEDLAVAPDGAAWATSPVAVVRKRPGDARWGLVRTGQPGWLRGGSFPDAATGWLVGERGLLLNTSDGGRTWSRQRESGRAMGLLYATAHDHHINGGPLSVVSERFDTAYVCCGRGIRAFELGGDYNRNAVAASAMAAGVPVVHSFVEFSWRERDLPHCIAQRYQTYGGIEGIERRLVAMIRTLRPRILVAEQPVTQEGYYAHGVGEVARAQILAFDSAADPRKFPELLELGLKPHAPQKLYIVSNWATEMYRIHPATLRVAASTGEYSKRLGMTFGEAKARSKNCFWGLLDRPLPPKASTGVGPWNLHLKKWRGEIDLPEQNLYDGQKDDLE